MSIEEDLENFREVITWTDDEWLAVMKEFPPETHIKEGIKYVRKLRSIPRQTDGIISDGS